MRADKMKAAFIDWQGRNDPFAAADEEAAFNGGWLARQPEVDLLVLKARREEAQLRKCQCVYKWPDGKLVARICDKHVRIMEIDAQIQSLEVGGKEKS